MSRSISTASQLWDDWLLLCHAPSNDTAILKFPDWYGNTPTSLFASVIELIDICLISMNVNIALFTNSIVVAGIRAATHWIRQIHDIPPFFDVCIATTVSSNCYCNSWIYLKGHLCWVWSPNPFTKIIFIYISLAVSAKKGTFCRKVTSFLIKKILKIPWHLTMRTEKFAHKICKGWLLHNHEAVFCFILHACRFLDIFQTCLGYNKACNFAFNCTGLGLVWAQFWLLLTWFF